MFNNPNMGYNPYDPRMGGGYYPPNGDPYAIMREVEEMRNRMQQMEMANRKLQEQVMFERNRNNEAYNKQAAINYAERGEWTANPNPYNNYNRRAYPTNGPVNPYDPYANGAMNNRNNFVNNNYNMSHSSNIGANNANNWSTSSGYSVTGYRRKTTDSTPVSNPTNNNQNPYGTAQSTPATQETKTVVQTVSSVDEEVIAKLERENIELKEKVEMLIELYKQFTPFIVGKNSGCSNVVSVDKGDHAIHTLLGKKNEEQPEEITVKDHFIRDDQGSTMFAPPYLEGGKLDISNVVKIGDFIKRDALSGMLDNNGGDIIYRHLTKVGTSKLFKTTLSEAMKESYEKLVKEQENLELLESENGEELEEPEDATTMFLRKCNNSINLFLSNLKECKTVMELVTALDRYEINPPANVPVDLIKHMKKCFMGEFNTMTRYKLGMGVEFISKPNVSLYEDANKGLTGGFKEYPRTPEEVKEYLETSSDLVKDFVNSWCVLELDLEYDDEANLDLLVNISRSYRVYSFVPADDKEVEDVIDTDLGLAILTHEGHEKLYSVMDSIVKKHENYMRTQEVLSPGETYKLNDILLRVSDIDGNKCSIFKVSKMVKERNGKCLYVMKKIYQSF